MSSSILLAAILLAAAAAMPAGADGGSHTVLLGSAVASKRSPRQARTLMSVRSFSPRRPTATAPRLGGSGFAALSASTDVIVEDLSSFEARQLLSLESRLEAGPGEIDGFAGAHASFFGDEPYVLANARIGYRFDGDA